MLVRMVRRLAAISDNLFNNLSNQINEYTVASIASFSVLTVVLSMIFCFVISLMREEEKRIKNHCRKLGLTGYHRISNRQLGDSSSDGNFFLSQSSYLNGRSDHSRSNLIELRRETYFGIVRLLKPGCRSVVLLCDAQSRQKLTTKFYQCIYPYRKIKTLQFAFLLIEKNIGWYKELLKLALNEKRDLHINPSNCIGTVLVINGFKKYFSVYHASEIRRYTDETLLLLEESLLDNFSEWFERLLSGRGNRYYVKYWPDRMR